MNVMGWDEYNGIIRMNIMGWDAWDE